MFRKIFLSATAFVLTLAVAVPALAMPSFLATENGVVSIDSPIGDDVYTTGANVTVTSDIKGDLFVSGGMVEVDANVAGDILVFSGNVYINGTVGDDLRIGAGQVTIRGTVNDDVLVGGGMVTVSDTAVIRGDLTVGAGSLTMSGKVLGNVKAGFGDATIKGDIGGNADLRYEDGKLTFGDGAKIGGKLDYWAFRESDEFAEVAKEIEFHKTISTKSSWPLAAAFVFPIAAVAEAVWSIVGVLIMGGLLLLLLPKYLPRIVETTRKKHWTALWQGLVFLIVVPVLAVIIALTGFGLPVSIIMMLAFTIVMILASIPVSMAIGSYMVKYKDTDRGRQFGALVLGVLIYTVLGLIPVIGWILKFALFVIGVGIIWMDSQTAIRDSRY
ncbi:MAG: polymer-forming cytoskeletal protein [Patescibacteria group bacterium]|nr:polymer-forming cytoskeletal protein [Patescibacteria group bacterium]